MRVELTINLHFLHLRRLEMHFDKSWTFCKACVRLSICHFDPPLDIDRKRSISPWLFICRCSNFLWSFLGRLATFQILTCQKDISMWQYISSRIAKITLWFCNFFIAFGFESRLLYIWLRFYLRFYNSVTFLIAFGFELWIFLYLTSILRFYRFYQMDLNTLYDTVFMEKCRLVWSDDERFCSKYIAT